MTWSPLLAEEMYYRTRAADIVRTWFFASVVGAPRNKPFKITVKDAPG